MINDFYSSNQFNRGVATQISVATNANNNNFGYSGFRSSVPSSIFSHNVSQALDNKTCPIGQSQIVQELTLLHSLLVQYLKNNTSPTSSTCSSNNSVCFTTPTKYSIGSDSMNFACGRFTSSSYSSESSISNPLLMSSSSATSPYGGCSSPVRSSIATTSFSSPTHIQRTFSNSNFQSFSSTPLSSMSEYEERISKLEQLVKQILSLIYRGDYKSPATDNKSSSQVVKLDSTNSIKQLLTSKIKETYQLDMEPLKQIVASVVHHEPKRLNMGYDIIFQMKTELTYLSQLCK